ncbi:hypothetical protein TWF481_007841 [Arthrobotrys musiformis]|uniref:Uncharacterized protein n=1 Tax=Arthrobotrys musiformis TaxID=47236 RepID=A0AAV9W7X8_9PEZI
MDRVRPSFMTKEQLDKYMNDVKQNRQPRPRPNFELPAKRLSMTFNDPPAEPEEKEDPKPEPIARVQTDTPVSAFRRYGGSVRDIQKSKGTVRTRNGWIIGDTSGKPSSPFGGSRQTAQSRIVEEPESTSNIKRVEEEQKKTLAAIPAVKFDDKEKESQTDLDSDSPLEESLEDSIIKLQNDISQEIEAVSILLDSPIDDRGDGPSRDVDDILDSYRDDPKPESPAPLKITRSLPVDIKHTLAIHQSQMPEPPVSITNTNKIGQYQVNAPPTPSSTPPELEKRPKFGDRGVPTYSSVAPPTPPTKVMIVEDDKLVAEMSLDDGKGEAGYNVQQGNPNAVVPSAEVSKIANKISELQMKADPWTAAPKPAFPNITMEEFQERNEAQPEPRPSQFAFNRTNSLPVGVSQDSSSAAGAKKTYDPRQYKPYRPPTQPASLPSTAPRPPFMRTRTGSESVISPPVCPSPAPHAGSSRAIPPHMNNAHGRHSSLGNIYQPNQPPIMAAYAATQNYAPLQHRHSMSTNTGYGQIQPMRHFQNGPPLPTHIQHQPGPQNHFNRQFHGSFGPSGQMGQPTISRMTSNVGSSGRSLPAIPTDLSKALPGPPTTNIINDPQLPPKQSSPVVEAPPVKNQTPPPIPTFSFDDTPTSSSRRLPAVPTQPQSKPLPTTRSFEDRKKTETKATPPVPVFSFSDDSTPAAKSIPSINFPDDSPSKPSSHPSLSPARKNQRTGDLSPPPLPPKSKILAPCQLQGAIA